MKHASRTTFLELTYADGYEQNRSVVIGGPGGKRRLIKLIKEVHPDWDIRDVKVIKRPSYAVKWSGLAKNKSG